MHMKNNNRRDFLKTSAVMAAGSLFLPKLVRSSPATRVKDIGIQLYTVRTEMAADAVAISSKIDTEGVAPMAQVLYPEEETATLRADVVRECLSNEEALANAPATGSGYFKVPKVIER